MTAELRAHLDDYLRLRRGLGFTLAGDGQVLAQFLGYLRQRASTSITTEAAIGFARLPRNVDPVNWAGRRDHAMLALTLQTGLRISELTSLSVADLQLGRGAHVHCIGKGRKQRNTPLLPDTVEVLRGWLAERRGAPDDPLFPTSTGRSLSRDAVERRITLYTNRARGSCPSLRSKRVTAHTLRHYVDGPVMWPAAASVLVAEPRVLVAAT